MKKDYTMTTFPKRLYASLQEGEFDENVLAWRHLAAAENGPVGVYELVEQVSKRQSIELRRKGSKGWVKASCLALALCMPTIGQAAPITLGMWSAVTESDGDGDPFWDGTTYDLTSAGIGGLIAEADLEYLHDGLDGPVAFTFDDPVLTWTLLYSVTGRPGGILSRTAAGAFTYDSGVCVSDSLSMPEQYALFRVLGGVSTRYVLGVEDIFLIGDPGGLVSDRDYQDEVVTFESKHPEQTPEPVPEPTTLALFGAGLVLMAYRFRI